MFIICPGMPEDRKDVPETGLAEAECTDVSTSEVSVLPRPDIFSKMTGGVRASIYATPGAERDERYLLSLTRSLGSPIGDISRSTLFGGEISRQPVALSKKLERRGKGDPKNPVAQMFAEGRTDYLKAFADEQERQGNPGFAAHIHERLGNLDKAMSLWARMAIGHHERGEPHRSGRLFVKIGHLSEAWKAAEQLLEMGKIEQAAGLFARAKDNKRALKLLKGIQSANETFLDIMQEKGQTQNGMHTRRLLIETKNRLGEKIRRLLLEVESE